jgi:hypothetical protein
MSSFRSIIDDVLAYAGQGSGGTFEDLVKNQINGVYKRILDIAKIPHEQREFSLISVANTSKYGLPLYVRKVLNIEDPTTPRFVWTDTARAFDKRNPGSTETGTPYSAYNFGTRGIEKLPNSDGTLTLVSSATGDAGANYNVRVTGFNTSGVLVTEKVQMNGTTNVTTTNSYDSALGVERIVKEPASGTTFSGNVTVSDDDANVISIIPVWWDSPDYIWIEFDPIPSAAITYTLRCEMRKPPLVNDSDWPEFDQEYHELLIYGVTQDLLPTVGKSGVGDRHRQTFSAMLEELTGIKSPLGAGLWIFGNVQAMPERRQRPSAPYIKGVHVGLAE